MTVLKVLSQDLQIDPRDEPQRTLKDFHRVSSAFPVKLDRVLECELSRHQGAREWEGGGAAVFFPVIFLEGSLGLRS